MAREQDDYLNIVQSLIAQAEDPTVTKAEAQAFMDKATYFMAKHGIDRAMADMAGKASRDEIINKYKDFDNPYATSKQLLYSQIAKAFACSPISTGGRVYKDGVSRNVTRTHLFGHASDIETVEELYTVLLLHGVNALNMEEIWGNAKSYRTSWWVGYAVEIGERLTKANRKVVDETPGSALVLRDRSLASANAMQATYPNRGTKRYGGRSSDGYGAGRAEGRKVGLGGQSVVNSGRRAIGN